MDFSTLWSLRRAASRAALVASLLVVALALTSPPARAQEEDVRQYCGTNIPPDEALGFVPLPEGDVFCPLLADPKSGNTYVAYVRGTSASPFGTDLGTMGVTENFGLMRWGGPNPGEGFQIGLQGGVFAQFDFNQPSYDLINADYVVGVPLTYRRGAASWRLRLYHQSSHLGDEFLLRSRIQRENFAFQSGEVILSADGGPLRVYAGGELVFNATPEMVETQIIHGGVELRQRESALRLGSLAGIRLIAAVDIKSVEDLDWKIATSARAGLEISRPKETMHAARRWSILGQYYDGPSPYGQFFREDVRYYGVGLHFSL